MALGNIENSIDLSADNDFVELVNVDSTETQELVDGHFQSTFDISSIKDEDLYRLIEDNQTLLKIEWDERLNINQNKDRKKKIKDSLLQVHKGKYVVDYKKV